MAAAWCSSVIHCRARRFECRSPMAVKVTGSCSAMPSRCSTRRATGSCQPLELFGHHCCLQLTLIRELAVLPVAPATPARTGEPAGWHDPVARRVEHLDGIAAQEPVTFTAIGDLHSNRLARQCMTDEHHAAAMAGHAVATVRDLADLRLELGADQRLARIIWWALVQLVVAHCSRLAQPAPTPCRGSSAPDEIDTATVST